MYLPSPEDIEGTEIPEDLYAKYIVEVLLPAQRARNVRPQSFESFYYNYDDDDERVLTMGPSNEVLEDPLAGDPEYRRIEERRYILERQLASSNLSTERREKLQKNLDALNQRETSLRDSFKDLMKEGREIYNLYNRYARGYSPRLDKVVDATIGLGTAVGTGINAAIGAAGTVVDGVTKVGEKVVGAVEKVGNLFKKMEKLVEEGGQKVDKIIKKAEKLYEKADKTYKKGERLVRGGVKKGLEKLEEGISRVARPAMEGEQKIRKILKKGGEALEETISAGVRTEEKIRTGVNQGLEKLEEGVSRVAKPLMEAEGAVRRTFQAA